MSATDDGKCEKNGKGKRKLWWRLLGCAAIAAALAWSALTAYSTWRYYVRSSNVLDELYYATFDSRCGEVSRKHYRMPDALISSHSLKRASAVDYMPSVESWHGGYYREKCVHDGYDPEYDFPSDCTTYKYTEAAAKKAGVASIEWYAVDNTCDEVSYREADESSRYLYIQVSFYALKFSKDRCAATDTIDVAFEYDVDKHVIVNGGYDGRLSADFFNEKGYMSDREWAKKHGIDGQEVVDTGLEVLKTNVLPEFLSREGSDSRFEADFERDGVMADVDSRFGG